MENIVNIVNAPFKKVKNKEKKKNRDIWWALLLPNIDGTYTKIKNGDCVEAYIG